MIEPAVTYISDISHAPSYLQQVSCSIVHRGNTNKSPLHLVLRSPFNRSTFPTEYFGHVFYLDFMYAG